MEHLQKVKPEIASFVLEKAQQYNQVSFIETDPIQIPHQFTLKQDIEIAGFLTATIAWGNRKSILTNAQKIVDGMDCTPFDFIKNHTPKDLQVFNNFVHRTFNASDLTFFISSLKQIYTHTESLESLFKPNPTAQNLFTGIENFRTQFLSTQHLSRVQKHIASPAKGSASKRLVMYLRWMVRQDKSGVDFGIWKNISPSLLSCPLDVHSGNVARKLGLLQRKQNDWKAVEELDLALRQIHPSDPALLDFALFGLGVFEGF